MTKELVALMIKSIQLALGVEASAFEKDDFFVETIFLKHWIDKNGVKMSEIEEGVYTASSDCSYPCQSIAIDGYDTTRGSAGTPLTFIYFGGTDTPGGPQHGLIIIDAVSGSVLYERMPGQSPRTQWELNYYEDDLKDEQGNFIFPSLG